MKKIKFDNKHITPPRKESILTLNKKYYTVFIKSDQKFYFKNKKEAVILLSKASHFATYQLYYINELYSNLYSEYRKIWGYFEMKENPVIAHEIRFYITQVLESIDNRLDLSYERQNYTEGLNMVFQWLRTMSIDLANVCEKLKEIHKIKGNHITILELERIQQKSLHIKNLVNTFGLAEHELYEYREENVEYDKILKIAR